MESLPILVYLISVVGSFDAFLNVLIFVGLVGLPVTVIGGTILADSFHQETRDKAPAWFKRLPKIAGATVLVALVSIIIPSKDTAYTMLAAYAGSEIVQTEEMKEIGGKSFEVLNKFLDDYLEDTKSATKGDAS